MTRDTGARLEDDLVSILDRALQGAETYGQYIEDADGQGVSPLAQLFRDSKEEEKLGLIGAISVVACFQQQLCSIVISMAKPTILVADLPEGVATIRKILKSRAAVLPAENLEQALRRLDAGVDAVVCGIHFEESRMFDLLRMVKADPQFRTLPFICFRDLQSELQPTFLQSLDIACKALGSAGFVDMHALKIKFGTRQADDEFSEYILSLAARRLGAALPTLPSIS